MAGDRAPVTADSLLMAAGGHARAAQILVLSEGEQAFNGIASPSIFMLIGFAVELSLKAAFLHLGGTEEDAKAIGHNLPKLLADINARGFDIHAVENLTHLVNDMGATHQSNYFRYMPERDAEAPDPTLALKVLIPHIVHVGRLLGLDANSPSG